MPTEQYFAIVKTLLSERGEATVRVTGNSMWPLLRHLRDQVVLVPPTDVKRGDVVLFDRQIGRYALHRVIRVKGDCFSMMGDHQWHMEQSLPRDQIVGKVAFFYRGSRKIPADSPRIKLYASCARGLAAPRAFVGRIKRYISKSILAQAAEEAE